MASSPHKIRFISIPGKETSPVLLMTREKFRRNVMITNGIAPRLPAEWRFSGGMSRSICERLRDVGRDLEDLNEDSASLRWTTLSK